MEVAKSRAEGRLPSLLIYAGNLVSKKVIKLSLLRMTTGYL